MSTKKTVIICITLILTAGIIAASFYLTNKNDQKVTLDNNQTNDITQNDESTLEYRTPWPPTELQSSCQKRLDAYLNRGGINTQILGGAYCGGTGKIIGMREVDGQFHKFVISEEQLLKD